MEKISVKSLTQASTISFCALSSKLYELDTRLEVAEKKYQELYEFAPVGYFDLDQNNQIIKLNLGGAQLLGTSGANLLGKFFSTFISKNSQALFNSHIQQVIATQIKQYCELELIREDGSSFYTELASILTMDSFHHEPFIRIAIVDIGERRQTEQALLANEEKFRSLIETTKEWFWSINLKGRFLYSNPAIESILGYPTHEILNSMRLLMIHKEDRPVVMHTMLQAIKSKQGWNHLIVRWHCKDGSYRYLESNSIPYLNSQGEIIGFHGSDRDITLRKQSDEQARHHQTIVSHAAKVNSLGELASTLAHELTQPLTAINNYITGSVKKMSNSNNYDASILDALKLASQQAERAGQIIHRMKDFVQRGKLHLEKVDINDIIYQAISLIKAEFPFSQVQIYFNPTALKFLITADSIQLVQVMLNLLRNGVEAMTEDCIPNPEIHIHCIYLSQNSLMVSVWDNGLGVNDNHEDALDKIFTACFTTKSKGLGLGLAISRTLIEAHQGQLIAHKGPNNRGLCFQFILPITPAD